MKVILNTDIEKIGEVGDIVEVKPGFARNYLFPKKMAVAVTKNNLYMMNARKKKIQKKVEIEKLSAQELKQKLEELTITIEKKAGENDVLFGSVTAMDIEDKLNELGLKIDRKKFHLEEQIKRLGNYSCKIKLFKDVEAELKIEVVGEAKEKPEKGEKEEPKKEAEGVKEKAPETETKEKTEKASAAEEKGEAAEAQPETEVKSEAPANEPAEKTAGEKKASDDPEEKVAEPADKKEKKTEGKDKAVKDVDKTTEKKKEPADAESDPDTKKQEK